jgi:hypothetical protein
MTSPPPLPPPFDPNKTFLPIWRQAYQWLNQCHVLSPEANRVLALPTSTIEDLADILSDGLFLYKKKIREKLRSFLGIVLCNLINYLVAGLIKYTDVSFRPQRSRVRDNLID